MRKILSILSIIFLAFLAQGQAHAQKFYLGAGIGYETNNTDTLTTTNMNVKDIQNYLSSKYGGSVKSSADYGSAVFRLIGGYQVAEKITIELGYTNNLGFRASSSGTDGKDTRYNRDDKTSYRGFDIATILRSGIASGFNDLFVTLGLHNYRATVSSSANPVAFRDNDSSPTGIGILFGGGCDFRLQKNLDLRTTLTRFDRVAGDSNLKITNLGLVLVKHF